MKTHNNILAHSYCSLCGANIITTLTQPHFPLPHAYYNATLLPAQVWCAAKGPRLEFAI
jgi:predicted adenine nucleotide alpha hydrolase (AANH) superfamily ATPase